MKIESYLNNNGKFIFYGNEENKFNDFRKYNIGKKITMTLQTGTRSYKHHKFYFACLKAILKFEKEGFNFINEDYLHKWLENNYAANFKKESFKKVKAFGKEEYVSNYSISFEKCSNEEFKNYMEFVENKCVEITGFTLDKILDKYSM